MLHKWAGMSTMGKLIKEDITKNSRCCTDSSQHIPEIYVSKLRVFHRLFTAALYQNMWLWRMINNSHEKLTGCRVSLSGRTLFSQTGWDLEPLCWKMTTVSLRKFLPRINSSSIPVTEHFLNDLREISGIPGGWAVGVKWRHSGSREISSLAFCLLMYRNVLRSLFHLLMYRNALRYLNPNFHYSTSDDSNSVCNNPN